MARAARKTPTKRRVKPYAQGDLDCMCAIYTIINAVRALCPEMTIGASEALFRRLIRSLHTHTNDALSPIIIGTNRTLLQKLLAEAQSYIAKRFKVDLDIQPQGGAVKAKSLDVVWDRLSAILDEQDGRDPLAWRLLLSLDGVIRCEAANDAASQLRLSAVP